MITKMFTVTLIAAMFLFNKACDRHEPPQQQEENVRKNIELTETQKGLCRTANVFTFDFLKILAGKEDKDVNIFASPFSLQTVLAMTAEGAARDTKEEMLTALRLSDFSEADIAEFYKVIIPALQGVDKKTVMEIANSLWSKEFIEIKEDFSARLQKNYYAECRTLLTDPFEAAREVNAWCSQKTHGMINRVVDQVSEDQMVALINALYFKGEWNDKFNERYSRDEKFHNHDGSTKEVTMMRKTDDMDVYLGEEAWSLSLPYGNRAYRMTIILPKEGVDVDKVVASLDAESWRQYLYRGYEREVNLSLPKFETEYSAADLCIKTLNEMGMEKAFKRSADFSGISDIALYISQIIHKAKIKVNEEGTEAAAVSYVGMELATAIPREEPIDFKVDRPFIYAISEVSTGAITFIGVQKQF